MRLFVLALLIIVTSLPAPPAAYAGKKKSPQVGVDVKALRKSDLTLIEGTLVSMDTDKRKIGGDTFVSAVVKDGDEDVPAWLQVGKKKKKQKPLRATGCCTNQSVVVVVNSHTADVPLVRHYTGPAFFSTTVVHNHSTTVQNSQYCAPVRRYCDCHRPIERYIYRNGSRVGHYCVTTGRPVMWHR